jgi:hypothetical protein
MTWRGKPGEKQLDGLVVPMPAMSEQSAVVRKSGATVDQSVPWLRRPTPPVTAGRKPAARSSRLTETKSSNEFGTEKPLLVSAQPASFTLPENGGEDVPATGSNFRFSICHIQHTMGTG